MRKMMVVLVVVVGLVACGDDDKPSAYAATYLGLCRAEQRARAGDVDAARAAFFNDSHPTLHQLAAAVEKKDRGRAARLLEAKNRVEQDLSSSSPGLAADLARLRKTTAAAAATTGGTLPSCNEKEP